MTAVTDRLVIIAVVTLYACGMAGAATGSDALTRIEVTDRVLREDTMRLGINTCSDNYWDSAIMKTRVASNFEGVMYRMVSWGPVQDENGIMLWFAPAEEAWDAMTGKVKYTLLGGPAKGTSGTVKDIRWRVHEEDRRKPKLAYIEFDKTVHASESNKNGILLVYENPHQGSIKETNSPHYWNTEQNRVSTGDVPPGSKGSAALHLRGSEKSAHYTFIPMYATQARQNGEWHIEFWAKGKAGEPELTVDVDSAKNPVLHPDTRWRRHRLTVDVKGLPPEKHVDIRFIASGGDVLVDDVVIWKEGESENLTAFRDPFVDLLKRLKPGVLRQLQMGGSDLHNNLTPRLSQLGWTRDFGNMVKGGRNSAKTYDFNMHDYYELCEHVDADPWYCLPGTLYPHAAVTLMEYLGAPPDTGYGIVRAEMGHPKPWTEVFDRIYIEFGNEAWNPGGYATGSFNGPDHWKDLIRICKESPHYRPNVVFVAGSQAANPWLTGRILEDVPNADRIGVAPYLMNGTRQKHIDHLDSTDALFRWVFGYTLRRVREPSGKVYRQHETTHQSGKELAIYEHQYHMTQPYPEAEGAVPLDTRKKIIASIGGAVNIMNDCLLMMRERGIRTQCLFNLNQKDFHDIPLWGFVPGLNVRDQRYRPLFLAMQICNEVMGGDLLETAHSGHNPTFSATGVFESNRDEKATYEDIPALWSYAFRDGARRGLILINLDTQRPHRVRLNFPGSAKGKSATACWLTAEEITANNEYENGEPQVEIRKETVDNFEPGQTLTLPPYSMVGLEWQSR